MTDSELLAEVEDILRTMPDHQTLTGLNDKSVAWMGRASALVEAWDFPKSVPFQVALGHVRTRRIDSVNLGLGQIQTILHQARHSLRMKTVGPINAVVDTGRVFDYFEELRNIISAANTDILFIDPYLEAEFVARYLPHIRAGVAIRLLGARRNQELVPAVETFIQQNAANVQVRDGVGIHDRYVIVDGAECYQSGASFKDGARHSPTTITQITDAFAQVHALYEGLWTDASVLV